MSVDDTEQYAVRSWYARKVQEYFFELRNLNKEE